VRGDGAGYLMLFILGQLPSHAVAEPIQGKVMPKKCN
jgi:hypothetical protein